jgi:opacity protein-like surface antigen
MTVDVLAQDAAEDPAAGEDLTGMDEEGGVDLAEEPTDAAAPTEGAEPAPEAFEAEGDRKPDGSTQLLMGVRYRALITPKFLINMFGVDGGRTVLVHGVGPEIGGYFGKTADGFMVLFSPWYAGYGLDETPFKGKKDDDSAWEIIESRMKIWYLTVDAMWDHKIIDRVSVNVGIGAGLGLVTGKLYRNEAYQTPAGMDPDVSSDKDWPDLNYCDAPDASGNPDPIGGAEQCPADGDYGSADRWPVYPWLNFQTGLRYQPVDEFVGRLDIGIGSSGFWIGLGADYSLFL